MIDPRWKNAHKLLLVRLDNLGDVLLMTPALRALKRALPQTDLTLLCSPVGAQVGRLNPDLAQVIVYEAPWIDPWQKLPRDSQREQEMIARLKAGQFDGAIIFTSFRQSSLPAAYLCYLADIPLRLAASLDGPGSLLTIRHRHPERMMHEVERALDLVSALGVEPAESRLVLRVPAPAVQDVENYLAEWQLTEQYPLIALHPGCTMPARTYPWELYSEVARLLVEQLDAVVLITGAAGERALVERVRERMPAAARERTLAVAGALPFPAFCGLLQRADLLITNNTGPMHIAAAVQTPVVALFALTNPPEQWGPWQVAHRQLFHEVACRLCYSRVCPYEQECLRLVSPPMIVQAAGELLAERVREKEGSVCTHLPG
ncbi:MAG TPA: glycosyltransferase family 9 protein [Ktedonobacteraceae bacterium]|jgi:ADP-heptose:LPS heptosyltransferase|nr:glycosyltransferase family 9 protein [Ktedonobacteraceae bacterium]